jgi:hypothetical protein
MLTYANRCTTLAYASSRCWSLRYPRRACFCPAIYVSLVLLYMCPHMRRVVAGHCDIPGERVSVLLYMCPSYCYICVLILLYMCPHTAMYVSSYCYVCVLILLYVCPILLYMCPHTAGEREPARRPYADVC